MPFAIGDGVYVVSLTDTGEVSDTTQTPINKVKYDELPGTGEHHDDDLRHIPFKGRIYCSNYYYVVKAEIVNGKRIHETKCLRNGGGRIFRKRFVMKDAVAT